MWYDTTHTTQKEIKIMLKLIFKIFIILGLYLYLFAGYTGIIRHFIAFLTISCLIYAKANHSCIVRK